MATPTSPTWAWEEEANLVNSHVNDRAKKFKHAIENTARPQAAARRRLGGNWIAYGPEESSFIERRWPVWALIWTISTKSKRYMEPVSGRNRLDLRGRRVDSVTSPVDFQSRRVDDSTASRRCSALDHHRRRAGAAVLGVHPVAGLDEARLLRTVGDPVSPEPAGGRLRTGAVSQLRVPPIFCAVVHMTIHQVLVLPPGPLVRRRRHYQRVTFFWITFFYQSGARAVAQILGRVQTVKDTRHCDAEVPRLLSKCLLRLAPWH